MWFCFAFWCSFILFSCWAFIILSYVWVCEVLVLLLLSRFQGHVLCFSIDFRMYFVQIGRKGSFEGCLTVPGNNVSGPQHCFGPAGLWWGSASLWWGSASLWWGPANPFSCSAHPFSGSTNRFVGLLNPSLTPLYRNKRGATYTNKSLKNTNKNKNRNNWNRI